MPDKKKKTIVAIELTNQCNIRCPHCPQGRVEVPMGMMNRDTFMQCLSYCEGYTEVNWRGEPTLHPGLVEYVLMAKTFNPALNLGFHTNGLLMTESLLRELANNGLGWIQVSLHCPESCFRYKEIIEWNRGLEKPLYIYADVDNTQEELTALSCGLTQDMFHKDNIANWAGFLTDYRIIYPEPGNRAQQCLFIKENKFIVAWDGSVNACCWDYKQLHNLGKVEEFETIAHNPPYELCKSCLWISK